MMNQNLDFFPHLFAPLKLKNNQEIRNRLIMGSMHTGLEDSWFNFDRLSAFYEERARGGVGLIVTGGFAPHWRGWLLPFSSALTSKLLLSKHKKLTERVHAHGAKIVLQILHAGRYSYHPFSVAPSALKSPITPFAPQALRAHAIESLIESFARTAQLAEEAGYDGIEIMGSEGYLINEFVSEKTNRRTDDWGGSFENRIRFPLQIVQSIRQKVNPQFIIMYRLSLLEFVSGGNSLEQNIELGKKLEQAGVDILGTGIGWHEARVPTIATDVPQGAFVWATEQLKAQVRIPVVASNRINTPELAENILVHKQADLISMARPWLADPEFALKAQKGQSGLINTCIACNQACLDHIFQRKQATCLVNPVAGYESKYKIKSAFKAKKIAVIGAGPAGLSFSKTAAQRGHQVTLFDQKSEIGGQFLLASQVPGKSEFKQTIRYFKNQLEIYKVTLRLNQKVTEVDLRNSDFDEIVIATGIKPRRPDIVGLDHPMVVSYIDILTGQVPVKNKVALVGAGGIGFDVAKFVVESLRRTQRQNSSASEILEFQKEWGISRDKDSGGNLQPEVSMDIDGKIYLMQRKDEALGKKLGKTTGWIHRAFLKKAKVDFLSGVEYLGIQDQGLEISHRGEKKTLPVNQIIICAGQVSLNHLFQDLQGHKKVHLIGGAHTALELDAKFAIRQGFELGLEI